MVAQQDLGQKKELFNMLLERSPSVLSRTSLKQHMWSFYFLLVHPTYAHTQPEIKWLLMLTNIFRLSATSMISLVSHAEETSPEDHDNVNVAAGTQVKFQCATENVHKLFAPGFLLSLVSLLVGLWFLI